jgi:hypothetical protein
MAIKGGLLVLAISVRDLERISEERGIDRANECLGAVGQRVLAAFGSGVAFCQTNINSIVVALKVENIEEASTAVDSLTQDLDSDIELGLGWVFKSHTQAATDLPLLTDLSSLIDAALLAASVKDEDSRALQFSTGVLEHALHNSRVQKQYNRALADYKLFSDLGATSPIAETQIAFVNFFGADRSSDVADMHFRRAASMDGATDTVKANLGCFLILEGAYVEGFSIVRDLELIPSYLASRFYAAYKSFSGSDFSDYIAVNREKAMIALDTEQAWLMPSQRDEILGVLRLALDD